VLSLAARPLPHRSPPNYASRLDWPIPQGRHAYVFSAGPTEKAVHFSHKSRRSRRRCRHPAGRAGCDSEPAVASAAPYEPRCGDTHGRVTSARGDESAESNPVMVIYGLPQTEHSLHAMITQTSSPINRRSGCWSGAPPMGHPAPAARPVVVCSACPTITRHRSLSVTVVNHAAEPAGADVAQRQRTSPRGSRSRATSHLIG